MQIDAVPTLSHEMQGIIYYIPLGIFFLTHTRSHQIGHFPCYFDDQHNSSIFHIPCAIMPKYNNRCLFIFDEDLHNRCRRSFNDSPCAAYNSDFFLLLSLFFLLKIQQRGRRRNKKVMLKSVGICIIDTQALPLNFPSIGAPGSQRKGSGICKLNHLQSGKYQRRLKSYCLTMTLACPHQSFEPYVKCRQKHQQQHQQRNNVRLRFCLLSRVVGRESSHG